MGPGMLFSDLCGHFAALLLCTWRQYSGSILVSPLRGMLFMLSFSLRSIYAAIRWSELDWLFLPHSAYSLQNTPDWSVLFMCSTEYGDFFLGKCLKIKSECISRFSDLLFSQNDT